MYPGVKQKQCNMFSSIEVTFHHKVLANIHHSKLEKTSGYLVCSGESFMPLSSPPEATLRGFPFLKNKSLVRTPYNTKLLRRAYNLS
jgi:hypothetical protein